MTGRPRPHAHPERPHHHSEPQREAQRPQRDSPLKPASGRRTVRRSLAPRVPPATPDALDPDRRPPPTRPSSGPPTRPRAAGLVQGRPPDPEPPATAQARDPAWWWPRLTRSWKRRRAGSRSPSDRLARSRARRPVSDGFGSGESPEALEVGPKPGAASAHGRAHTVIGTAVFSCGTAVHRVACAVFSCGTACTGSHARWSTDGGRRSGSMRFGSSVHGRSG